ncbi:MAG: RsmG family class I SAM-dependent methyltransferase [Acidimicrobiales bacterium]
MAVYAEDGQSALLETLGEARGLGLLGPGPLQVQIDHARGFAWAVGAAGIGPPGTVLDLGSGGGLPGLVLALAWPGARITLLEAAGRRVAFLRQAVVRCGLEGRVSVVEGRAEEVGRDPDRRAGYQVVVARSFGRPATTAECAAPFLEVGGALVVSERPDGEDDGARWSEDGLALLGLGPAMLLREAFGFAVIPQVHACPDRYPRRVGVPAKRPLF